MSAPSSSADGERFISAVRLIDEENAHDPRRAEENGVTYPFELLYARRLTAWIVRLDADASDALLLAARGQHIGRWQIPRENYPEGLNGYLTWRETLKEFHAAKMSAILETCGYARDLISRVGALIRKDDFPDDAEGRVLEDALCLVFIESQLAEFASSKPREKTIDIIRKTWEKMTPQAHALALELQLPAETRSLIADALAR